MYSRFLTIIFLLFNLSLYAQSQQAVCNCFLIKETGNRIEMEKLSIQNNGVEVVTDPSVITVVLTLGEGLNGDMVTKASRGGMLVIQCKDGQLKIKKREASGAERVLPDMNVTSLAAYSIRVNIVGGNGQKKAFKILNYDNFSEDQGPVIDMFGGRIPIQAGDYLITTETKKSQQYKRQLEKVGFIKIDGWMVVPFRMPDGTQQKFVVDMAATTTVVDKSILSSTSEIQSIESVAYDGTSKKVSTGIMQGATGDVSSTDLLGRTILSDCVLGTLTVKDLWVSVLNKFPTFLTDHGIRGILGLDVLKQFDKVSFIDIDKESGVVLFGGLPASVSTAFKMTSSGGLYFTEGSIGGIPIQFVFDTGARQTTLGKELVKDKRIEISHRGVRQISGINGAMQEVETGVVKEILLHTKVTKDVEVSIADVSALQAIGQEKAALLGMSFFSKFKSMYFHFEKLEWGF